MRQVDRHTKEGAEGIAQQIRDYWAAQGKAVKVWTVEEPFTQQMREAYWVVRSDMVNGMPQKERIVPISKANQSISISHTTKRYEINDIARVYRAKLD